MRVLNRLLVTSGILFMLIVAVLPAFRQVSEARAQYKHHIRALNGAIDNYSEAMYPYFKRISVPMTSKSSSGVSQSKSTQS